MSLCVVHGQVQYVCMCACLQVCLCVCVSMCVYVCVYMSVHIEVVVCKNCVICTYLISTLGLCMSPSIQPKPLFAKIEPERAEALRVQYAGGQSQQQQVAAMASACAWPQWCDVYCTGTCAHVGPSSMYCLRVALCCPRVGCELSPVAI